MRLVQLLMQRGFVSTDQLRSVPGAETMADGQLGSTLVAAGLVSTDHLALALSDQLGIPPALESDFLRADPALRKRLRAHQAANFKCIPLYATATRRVAVAMVDPTHPKILEELAFVLGAAVEPMVTSEAEHAHQLELLYGMPRRRTTGFHPLVTSPAAEPGGVVAGRVPTGEVSRAVDPGEETPTAPAMRPRGRVSKQTQSYLAAVKDLPLFVPAEANAPRTPMANPLTPTPPMVSVTGSDRAVEQILASPDRQAAADNLFAFMRSCFAAGAMFVVNGIFAMGRFGYNEGAECPAVESLVFSLSLPSAFRQAHTRGEVFCGAPPPEGEVIHGPLWAALRCPMPREILVAPVVAGGQVSLLLYAHGRKHGRIEKFALSRMEHVCSALGNTLVRLAG